MGGDQMKHIGDETPHVFRLRASPGGGARAVSALGALVDRAEIEASLDGDVVTISSVFSPRSAAVLRPLNVLRRARIEVVGCEFVDLILEVPARRLSRAVESWRQGGEASRRRIEKLAGHRLLHRLLEGYDKSDDQRRPDWAFAIGRAAFNTTNSESLLLEAAASMTTSHAHALITAADERARLCALTGSSFQPPPGPLGEIIRQGDYNAELALRMLYSAPRPLPVELVDLLIPLTNSKRDLAEAAVYALVGAPEDERIEPLLSGILSDQHRDAAVRATALSTLTARSGLDAATPFWRDFLSERSANLRWAAEDALAQHGTATHVGDGAAQLSKIIRRKSSVSYHPPRGAAMLDFVAAHSDQPVARRALDDVAARWDRLEPDLRAWIAEKHPSIEPFQRTEAPEELDVESEPPMRHAPPSIDATDNGTVLIGFWETDMHEVREPFEELLGQEEGVVMRSSDREFIEVVSSRTDLPALVAELWELAHES